MLRLSGQGESDDGGTPGDLYVVVHVKRHRVFQRVGDDIVMELPISVTQAALGAEVEVPTLEQRVKLTIPSGTQPDTILKLKGQGMPRSRWRGRGDQLVQIKLIVPKKLKPHQRELLEKLAKDLDK
jgi:molecular chaperone DnaJ